MGQSSSIIKKINYEDLQKNLNNIILINTISENKQDCLIVNTIDIKNEERIINKLIKDGNYKVTIFIYGENSNDSSLYYKYNQISSLGFTNIFIYVGGLFEWLCLQDIYGSELFPTTKKELDILKYKPISMFNSRAITND